jgi:acetyl esterase
MPLHPEAEEFLAIAESFGDPPLEQDTPTAVRARLKERQQTSAIHVHEVRAVDCSGVPARLYRPSDGDALGLLVYFHGGGWTICNLDTHDDMLRRLTNDSGCAVLSVDYRLAPEHPFPAPLDDSLAATAWAYEHADELGCDSGRLAIGGDSAGGSLAAVVSQHEAAPLRFQLLVYPCMDARCHAASYEDYGDGPFLTTAGMRWFIDHYLCGGAGAIDDPRVSPLLADDAALAKSPPTLVITAEIDPVRDDGEAYAERLRQVGVPASVSRYDGMFHAFVSFAEFMEDGRRAIREAGTALRTALGD